MAGTVTTQPAASGDVRELRLALVCYGGVSLAIYMHGATKELHKLLLASAAYEQDQQKNPFAQPQTEYVYWDLLSRMQQGAAGRAPSGVRTRVVVDIISGTSAGGINGVCLAKALAEDAPQDGLRDLWLKKGAIGKLLGGGLLPPLAGNRMLGWLRTAFADM